MGREVCVSRSLSFSVLRSWRLLCGVLYTLLLAGLLSGLAPSSAFAADDVQTTIDRSTGTMGGVFKYEVHAAGGAVSVSPPRSEDFRVVGQQTFSSFRSIGGRRTTQLHAIFTLSPTRPGALETGNAQITFRGGQTVQAESFHVAVHGSAPSRAPGGPVPRHQLNTNARGPVANGDASDKPGGTPRAPTAGTDAMYAGDLASAPNNVPFVHASVSSATPYAGQQVIVDYLLYVPMSQSGFGVEGASEPLFEDFWYQDVRSSRSGRGSMLGNQRVHGALYEVHLLRSYLVVPLNPGVHEIPPMEVDARTRAFLRAGRELSIRSTALEIQVRPLPEAGRPANFYEGNVGSYTLTATVDDDALRAGDTARVQLTVRGTGIDVPLRLPDFAPIPGARMLAPNESSSSSLGQGGWMEAELSRTIAVQPLDEGTLRVPGLSFSYFNPWTETYEESTTEALELTVLGRNEAALGDAQSEDELGAESAWLAGLPSPRELSDSPGRPARLDAFSGGAAFFALLFLGIFLPPVVVGFGAWRASRLASAPERDRAAAGSVTAQRIERAPDDGLEAYATIARELRAFVSARGGERVHGASRVTLTRAATAVFGEACGGTLSEVIMRAEEARFGGGEAWPPPTAKREALAVLRAAEESL